MVVERVYHTKACQQAMMETFRTYTEIWTPMAACTCVSSTQIVFHVRRILANALDIPKSKIHVEKPRIGGGFGAKQTVVAEVYPAHRHLEDRQACQDDLHPLGVPDCRPRRVMRWRCRCAWAQIRTASSAAMDVYTLSNTGRVRRARPDHGRPVRP